MFGSVVMRGLVGAVSGVPILLSAVVQNESSAATALVLTYDTPMDQLAAINLANFTLSLGITFASSSWTSSTVLKLVMSTVMWIDESTTVSIVAAAVKSAVGVPSAAVVSSAVTNNSTRTPFNLSGAHDGYDAGAGVTNISGQANAITDQTGQGNTLTAPASTGRPDIVANWRNGRTALLGRVDPGNAVCLFRTTHANGGLAQPFTRYVVGQWYSSVKTGDLVIGQTSPAQTYLKATTGRPSVYTGGAGAKESPAPSSPAAGSPFIWRTVFLGSGISARIEPHAGGVISWNDVNGNGVFNGPVLMGSPMGGAFNWESYWAWELDIAGDLPTSQPALDARIMAWLQNRYNIVHI